MPNNIRWTLPCLQLLEKSHCTGVGNGAEVLDEFLTAHADAGIRHGQCARISVKIEGDGKIRFRIEHLGVGQHLELQAVQRI
ncbi:MAG: hypothetical protein BWY63_00674 [Chloroflexi bacterium ADurb.Bin360]|nr:MAG: hypothetical protein BWY63_00674 [Chloroflexi bacterium ADurb.Bin360]